MESIQKEEEDFQSVQEINAKINDTLQGALDEV